MCDQTIEKYINNLNGCASVCVCVWVRFAFHCHPVLLVALFSIFNQQSYERGMKFK